MPAPGRLCSPAAYQPPALPSSRPTLFSLNFGSSSPGTGARRRRPLLRGLRAAAPALPVIGEHALVDHHDQEGAHAVEAGRQQLQEHGQRFGRRHPQLLLMSVCGGFRGGFSFNPGMLTSMNFRHGCGGGRAWRQGPAARGPAAAAPGGAGGAGVGGLFGLRALRPGSLRGCCPSPPRGRNAAVHTPREFARALCNAGSEGRGRARLGLGWAGSGPGEGTAVALSPGREGEAVERQPLGHTGTPGGQRSAPGRGRRLAPARACAACPGGGAFKVEEAGSRTSR